MKILATHFTPFGLFVVFFTPLLSCNELLWRLLDVFFADNSCISDFKQKIVWRPTKKIMWPTGCETLVQCPPLNRITLVQP